MRSFSNALKAVDKSVITDLSSCMSDENRYAKNNTIFLTSKQLYMYIEKADLVLLILWIRYYIHTAKEDLRKTSKTENKIGLCLSSGSYTNKR